MSIPRNIVNPPLILAQAQNGGWIITQNVEGPQPATRILGAYADTADMLEGLAATLHDFEAANATPPAPAPQEGA